MTKKQTKEKVIVICCPTYENMTEKDKQEIYNLLKFKEQIKKLRGNKND